MSRDDLGLIAAGIFLSTALILCINGHLILAFVALAFVGGALAVAGEAQ